MTGKSDGPRSDRRLRAEQEVDEELAFHRERTVADLIAGGLSQPKAEAEASRRFGPEPGHRSRLVRMELRRQAGARRRATMGIISMSVRSVVRGLRRSPGFTLGVVAILTLGSASTPSRSVS